MEAHSFKRLALFDDASRGAAGLARAAERRQLSVELLPPDPDAVTLAPDERLAWRCPAGFVEAATRRRTPLGLTAATAEWFADLDEEVTGRRLSVLTVADLRAGARPPQPVATVKLATHKLRSFRMARVAGTSAALAWARELPGDYRLLLSDRWLDCHSEYRVFTVGRRSVAWSPYLIEGEPWTGSSILTTHRASFHDEAAAFVTAVLEKLPAALVPPGIVLDVARLEDGRLVLLEANASWGSGLYGCDPDGALESVLAANRPDPAWTWHP